MADIFISYARPDQKAARDVAAGFQAHGWSVWFDDRLVPGDSWDEVIERELTAARCVVVLWSKAAANSNWVRNESRRAGGRLVPATLDSTGVPFGFEHLQAVNLTGWNGHAGAPEFERLVEGVTRQLSKPPIEVKRQSVVMRIMPSCTVRSIPRRR